MGDYKTWYEEAMVASNEAGFVGVDAATTIRRLAATVPQDVGVPEGLRAKVIALRKNENKGDTVFRIGYNAALDSVKDLIDAATPNPPTATVQPMTLEDAAKSFPNGPFGQPHITRPAATVQADCEDALRSLADAASHADCACSVRERDSGHRVGCWMPTLREAIDAARAKGQA